MAARTRRGLQSRLGASDDGWVALAGVRVARIADGLTTDDRRRPDSRLPMAEEKYTRCPGCKTVFRVTPQQLAMREGQVRCGHCRTVFDGASELVSLAPRLREPTMSRAYDEAALGPADGDAAQRAGALARRTRRRTIAANPSSARATTRVHRPR